MKDGDWAWPLFKGSPDLWLHTFHSNPLDYVANPRATPKTPAPIDPVPDVTQDEPCFVDPASLKKANSAKRAPRILYDSLVHEQIFGTVLRRCDSEDNLFINPNNGQNNSDYMYRTKTYTEFVTNNQKYSPTSAQYKIYFERINEAQFALYYSERDFNAKNDNWTRMGLTFHEYYHLQVSRHEGDLTAHDSQGLLYQFERRVNQNKLGPADQRWTTDQITRGRHVCRSLLRCCALDSAYFRSDLFRLNYHNIDNLQSLGMDGIMATTKFVDAQRKEREHKVQYVLEKISKFSTLCPLAAERKNLRMILGFDDSLKSSDSLLSPVDASSILSSIQLLPKWPRVVFTLDSYHLGASIGQLMCTVFESQSEHQDTEIPVSVANTNSDSFGQSQISQSSTHRNFLAAAKSTQAPAVNYSATVQNLPAIPPANVNDIADVGALSTTDASSSVSTSEPSSVSTISEPAIAEDLVPALHGRLDMADNSENGIYFNPERFSTWLYLHHHAPESLPGSDRVSTVDSDGQSYEPLEAGCEPDPRSSLARSTYHPPMAPQSTLYDDYESDSGEDNRSFFSNASSKSSSSCVTEIITPDTDASSVPSRLTVSSFESMVIVPEDPNLVSDMLPDAVISSASSSGYLMKIGIYHYDLKMENILFLKGIPKIIDFGLVFEKSGRSGYREMGYARRGTKFRHQAALFAATPGFAHQAQFTLGQGYRVHNLYYFLFCDWNSSWTLLYKPIDENERKIIDEIVKNCNASSIHKLKEGGASILSEIKSIISIPSSSSIFCLDDENLTKSCHVSSLKQNATRCVNQDLENLTKNVLDQKISNLCVPISVATLLKFAMKNDLGFEDKYGYYSAEKILSTLTLIIYPRSMAGLNLNPNEEETKYQFNEIELLLERICKNTYLMPTGWQITRQLHPQEKNQPKKSTCKFEAVDLNDNFTYTRPLTVTGAYLFPEEVDNGITYPAEVLFHQMVLDRVDDSTDEYVVQNTSFDIGGSVLRIPKSRAYYVAGDVMFKNCYGPDEYKFTGTNGEFMWLANERFGNTMQPNTWYLLPQAYSITLVPEATVVQQTQNLSLSAR